MSDEQAIQNTAELKELLETMSPGKWAIMERLIRDIHAMRTQQAQAQIDATAGELLDDMDL